MALGCHNCHGRKTRSRCATCKRIDHDDLRIAKTPHVANPDLVAAASPAKSRADEMTERFVDALRVFLDLSPSQLLTLQSLALGRSPAAHFRRVAKFALAVRRAKRSTAAARFDLTLYRIAAKSNVFRDFIARFKPPRITRLKRPRNAGDER